MKPKSETTVVVGMSGGVDSSVSAYLLKQQGYRVIGLFMRNWEEEDVGGQCPAEADHEDVVHVCRELNIPFYTVNLAQEYWNEVFETTLEGFRIGITPNPDVLCNREIKFKTFLEKALAMGADYLATGHYCRNPTIAGKAHLAKGLDPDKDQSYFLHAVGHQALEKVLFPIGGMSKREVRAIAQQAGLITAQKRDSTGICFVGKRDFREFLSHYLPTQPGTMETPEGEPVGEHVGLAFYTIGQRKGIGLGGPGEPWFVVGKDVSRNRLIVARGGDHPALFSDELEAEQLNWVSGEPPSNFPLFCKAKVRYRQQDQACTLLGLEGGKLSVSFHSPQRAVTLGQSVVFYEGDICLGGGVITQVGSSYHQQGRSVLQN